MVYKLKITKSHPWAGVTKYKDCFDYVSSYWTRSGNRYTGLKEADARRLEKELGHTEGTLAPSNIFWNTFAIKLSDRDLLIDDSNALGELQYLFLKSHRRVANGLNDIRPGTDYVLINQESEAIESNRLNKVRRDAMKAFDKMSIEDMRKCLRLYGYKSDTMSNELIESKLFELVEKDPKKFFTKWIDNQSKDTEFLIEAAIAKNILRKNRNAYYYGTDLIGSSLDDVVAYLDNKNNIDLKKTITLEVNSK
jgi:hypothetical protein